MWNQSGMDVVHVFYMQEITSNSINLIFTRFTYNCIPTARSILRRNEFHF